MQRRSVTVKRRSPLKSAAEPTTSVQIQTASGEARTVHVPDVRRLDVPGTVEVETRDDGAMAIRGLGIVFDARSQDLGGFTEQIDRGAVRKLLAQGPDVRVLANHDPSLILGRTKSNTAQVQEVPKGVLYRAVPPDTQYARDWLQLIQRGDVDGSSFSFTVERDRWEEEEDGTILRTVLELRELFDIGPVAFPAYLQTDSVIGRSEDTSAVEVGDTGQLGDMGADAQLVVTGAADEDGREAREALHREMVERAKRRRARAVAPSSRF